MNYSAARALTVIALSLVWLNPFTFGPSPAVVPWLFAFGAICFILLLCATCFAHYRTPFWPEVAAGGWFSAATLSSLFALLQYYGHAAPFAPWINYTDIGEAFANLRQRNQFATLTNIGLAALLWWTVQPRFAPLRAAHRWMWFALAALLALGNAASASRTGLVQLVMLLAITLLLWRNWRKPAVRQVLAVYVAVYVLALWLLPWSIGLEPFSTSAWGRLRAGDAVCSSRMTLWRNVLYLIELRPWTGWGWGELDFAHFSTPYPGARFCDILDNAHNLPLHLAVELGVPVAVLVCGTLLWLMWRQRPWAEEDATRQMAWLVLALIALHSMLEYPLWYGPFQIAVGLCVLLLWRRADGTGLAGVAAPRANLVLRLALGGIATLMLAAVCYVAWDYHRISQLYLAPAERAPAYRQDTLAKAKASWLFRDQVAFAELTTTPLTPDNAQHQYELATQLLHFSPEPRVIEILIESAIQLQRWGEVRMRLAQYRAAFPKEHDAWAARQRFPQQVMSP